METVYINEKVGFIGGGNMAKAISQGITLKGLVKYNQIYVSGPHIENLTSWKDKGAHISTSNGLVVENADIIFLSVKPHILSTAVENIKATLQKPVKSKLFVSILAGVSLEQLEAVLCTLDKNVKIIRVMPNTPMMVGEGCSVFAPGQRAVCGDIKLVKTILELLGICKQVPESLIDPVTALSGSGPAFVYLMIEALADGAVKQGIPRDMAIQFASQTVLGASKMVLETKKHTGVLKDEVCSPGGTTITGVYALEKAGFRGVVMDAIEAAAKKAVELGEKNR